NGSGSGIGRITPGGTITEFTGPGSPGGITARPDGALWFTEIAGDKIGRMTTAGVVTDEIPITAGSDEITTGPDGALWFAEAGKDQIGRIDPTTQNSHRVRYRYGRSSVSARYMGPAPPT